MKVWPDRARRLREPCQLTELASSGPSASSQRGPATGIGLRYPTQVSSGVRQHSMVLLPAGGLSMPLRINGVKHPLTAHQPRCRGRKVRSALLIGAPLHAQTGSIAGRVSGPVGVLEAVRVEVSGPALSTNRITNTDDRGFYRVADLTPGQYRVTFFSPGFQPHVLDNVLVSDGFIRNAR